MAAPVSDSERRSSSTVPTGDYGDAFPRSRKVWVEGEAHEDRAPGVSGHGSCLLGIGDPLDDEGGFFGDSFPRPRGLCEHERREAGQEADPDESSNGHFQAPG